MATRGRSESADNAGSVSLRTSSDVTGVCPGRYPAAQEVGSERHHAGGLLVSSARKQRRTPLAGSGPDTREGAISNRHAKWKQDQTPATNSGRLVSLICHSEKFRLTFGIFPLLRERNVVASLRSGDSNA